MSRTKRIKPPGSTEAAWSLPHIARSSVMCRSKKQAPRKSSGPSGAEQALQALNPDELTPKQALEALYELKALLVKEP